MFRCNCPPYQAATSGGRLQRSLVAALYILLATLITGCSTSAQIHWSPDGTAAAYCYRERAVVIDSDGAVLAQLGRSEGGFTWSADSKTLYYATIGESGENAIGIEQQWKCEACLPAPATRPAEASPDKPRFVELVSWSNRKSTPLVRFAADAVVYMTLSPDQAWLAFACKTGDAHTTYVCHIETKKVYLLSQPSGVAMCWTGPSRLAYIEPAGKKPINDFRSTAGHVVEVVLDAKAQTLERKLLMDVIAGETFWLAAAGDDLLLTGVARTIPGPPIHDNDLLANVKLFMWTRANGGLVPVADAVGPLFAPSPDGGRVLIHKVTARTDKVPMKVELMVIRTNGSDGQSLRTMRESEPMQLWPAWRNESQVVATGLEPKSVSVGGEPRVQYDVVLYHLNEKGQLVDGKVLSDSWDPDLKPWEKPATTQEKK